VLWQTLRRENKKTTIRGITMERSDSVNWFLRARRFALGASVALLTVVLTVGCGSSSSSSTDPNPPPSGEIDDTNGGGTTPPPSGEIDDTNGGGTTPPPSGEISSQDIAVQVSSLAFEFEDYASLLDEAALGTEDPGAVAPFSIDAGSSDNHLVNVTRSILNLTKDAGEIGIQATVEGFCDTGTVDVTENVNGYVIVFDQCQSELLGTTFEYNGKTTYEERENGGTLTYEEFQSSLSKTGDILTIVANGTIDLVVTDPFVPAGKVTLDLSYDLSVACGGAEASGSFGYSGLVIEVANDGGITIAGDVAFAFTDADGSSASVAVTIATVEPIRFKDELSVYPSSGKVTVTTNGQTSTIEYVEGGVWIDGVFFSWEEIEASVDEDDFDSVFDQCSFLDFDFDA
jgi:hypothetical protein